MQVLKGAGTKCVGNVELSYTCNEMKIRKKVSVERSSAGVCVCVRVLA